MNTSAKLLMYAAFLGAPIAWACVGAFHWRQAISRPAHVARECEFIAALEKKRLTISEDLGPAPLEWRRVEAVVGEPLGWRGDKLKHRLVGAVLSHVAPRNRDPIGCAAALDRAQVPHRVGNTEQQALEKLDTFGRARYSRVVFLPGDAYAIVSRTFCDVTRRAGAPSDTGWDQETKTDLWRREGGAWVVAEPKLERAVWYSPRHRLPSRCFAPDVSG